MLRVKLLRDGGRLPTRATPESVGLDLYLPETTWVQAGETKVLKLGIAIELPPQHEAQVRGRSGLAARGLHTHLGTIDADYRGEVGVIMHNTTTERVKLEAGDRVGQLVLAPVRRFPVVAASELSDSERGEGGFGSTGR